MVADMHGGSIVLRLARLGSTRPAVASEGWGRGGGATGLVVTLGPDRRKGALLTAKPPIWETRSGCWWTWRLRKMLPSPRPALTKSHGLITSYSRVRQRATYDERFVGTSWEGVWPDEWGLRVSNLGVASIGR